MLGVPGNYWQQGPAICEYALGRIVAGIKGEIVFISEYVKA
jgi:hypothetical protein